MHPYIDRNDAETKKAFLSERAYNPSDSCLNGFLNRFADIVKQYPNRTAIEQTNSPDGKISELLTYREMDEASNRIAHTLRKSNIKCNQIVLLRFQNVTDLSCGIWGVIKSGAAYCVIDPVYSKNKVADFIKKIKPAVVVTDRPELFSDFCSDAAPSIISFLTIQDAPAKSSTWSHKPDNLLYCILTSGTGTSKTPKAVAIYHKGVLNTVCWRLHHYGYSENSVTFSLLNPSFDAFGADFFCSTLSGGRLICARCDIMSNYQTALTMLMAGYVTNLSITPTNLYNLLLLDSRPLPSIQTLIMGGECISQKLLNLCFQRFPNSRIYNEYGPTENSIITTSKQMLPGTSNDNIGKEIPNTTIYLLKDGKIAEEGEIYLSGIGLAKGYLDQQQSKEAFFSHPYIDGLTIYKTGDLARKDSNGDYHFLGRTDRVVKVHGYTVDLNQLEQCAAQLDTVAHATAQLYVDSKTQHQVIYLTVGGINTDTKIDTKIVEQHIQKSFPDCRIPIKVRQTARFSVNDHQKADNQKIYLHNRDTSEQIFTFVSNCWKKILKKDSIDPDTSFFDLGGNSLLAMDLFFELESVFQDKIELLDIFENYTIHKLVDFLMEK